MSNRPGSIQLPPIPPPSANLDRLASSVAALKQAVEILAGSRSRENENSRAVTFEDLVRYGVLTDRSVDSGHSEKLADFQKQIDNLGAAGAGDLATEAATRAAADTAEASARASADTTEATARAAADTSEATARAAGDVVFTGDSGSGGAAGRVPAPASGDGAAHKFLRATGGWAVPDAAAGSGPTTWTPTDQSGASLTITDNGSYYYTFGKIAIVVFDVTYPNNADGGHTATIGVLPVAGAAVGDIDFNAPAYAIARVILAAVLNPDSTPTVIFYNHATGVSYTNADLSLVRIRSTLVYFTA